MTKQPETPEEIRERLQLELETVAAVEAVAGLRAIVRDPTAPAPARATAGVAILRSAGFITTGRREERGPKQPHEMSAEELERAIQKARRQLARSESGAADEEDGEEDLNDAGGVFS